MVGECGTQQALNRTGGKKGERAKEGTKDQRYVRVKHVVGLQQMEKDVMGFSVTICILKM